MSEKGKHPTKPAPPQPKKRLYRVLVYRTMYVVAESLDEAKAIGLREDPNNAEMSTEADEATLSSIEHDQWFGAFVYGTPEDETAEDACKRLNPS